MENTTVTPHRAGGRYFITYEDFIEIGGDDLINGCALRVLEVKTNKHIDYLRAVYTIPDGFVPHDDDLWIEVTTRDLEAWSLGIRRKSSYARALAMTNAEGTPKSLVQLGLVHSRYIARPGWGATLCKPARLVQRDREGSFIVVDDRSGGYLGSDGVMHQAPAEGYGKIVLQHRYNIEAVRAAIARLDDDPPPRPAPRWRPVRGGPDEGNMGRGGAPSGDDNLQDDDARNTVWQTSAQGGSSKTGSADVFASENTTGSGGASSGPTPSVPKERGNAPQLGSSSIGQGRPKLDRGVQYRAGSSSGGQGASKIGRNKIRIQSNREDKNQGNTKKDSAPLSLLSSTLDFEFLRTAPWSTETLIGLSSRLLAVPCTEHGDEKTWATEWVKPAERLLAATCSLEPSRAWERINLVIGYMTAETSPSWWVQGRARLSPVTLRHVADNFVVQDRELRTAQWYSSACYVAYDGPPLFWSNESLPQTDDVPAAQPKPRCMTRRDADALAESIMYHHPGLIVGYKDVGEDVRVLCIKVGPDAWRDIRDFCDWLGVTDEEVAAAVEYGKSVSDEGVAV